MTHSVANYREGMPTGNGISEATVNQPSWCPGRSQDISRTPRERSAILSSTRHTESQNRCGEYSKTTVFGWLYSNITVRRHLPAVYSAKFRISHDWFTVMQKDRLFPCELPARQHDCQRCFNIWIRIRLFTNFFYDTELERRWPRRIKKASYICNEQLWWEVTWPFRCLIVVVAVTPRWQDVCLVVSIVSFWHDLKRWFWIVWIDISLEYCVLNHNNLMPYTGYKWIVSYKKCMLCLVNIPGCFHVKLLQAL